MPSKVLLSLIWLAASAAPAFAQGYIGASLVGDMARFDQYNTRGVDSSGNGEVLGFGLRIGDRLGARWGVELEFVRPSEIKSEMSPEVFPALVEAGPSLPGSIFPVDPSAPTSLVFSYPYRVNTRQRNTTLSAGLWIRHEVSRKFSLAYIGGIAFGRTITESEVNYGPIRPLLPNIAPIILPPSITETTTYDVGPLVGVEGRIGLTEHAQFVPGIRLHAIQGGWLIRPSLGLSWVF